MRYKQQELEKEKLAANPSVKTSNSSLQDKMKNVDKFFSERKPKV